MRFGLRRADGPGFVAQAAHLSNTDHIATMIQRYRPRTVLLLGTPRSPLTRRTVEGGATSLRDSPNRSTAAGRTARLALALVDAEATRTIRAFLTRDRFAQDSLNRRRQTHGSRTRAFSGRNC